MDSLESENTMSQIRKALRKKMKRAGLTVRKKNDAEKMEMAIVLSERRRYAAGFSKDPKAHAEVTEFEKRVRKLAKGDIIDLGKEIATERLRARYGKSCLQKKDVEREEKPNEETRAEEIERLRKISEAKLKRRGRNARRRGVKPVTYTLARLVNADPRLKYGWAKNDSGNW